MVDGRAMDGIPNSGKASDDIMGTCGVSSTGEANELMPDITGTPESALDMTGMRLLKAALPVLSGKKPGVRPITASGDTAIGCKYHCGSSRGKPKEVMPDIDGINEYGETAAVKPHKPATKTADIRQPDASTLTLITLADYFYLPE